ncbi:MAG: endonuclease VII domain-containing protein [Actinomycetes bacterium]
MQPGQPSGTRSAEATEAAPASGGPTGVKYCHGSDQTKPLAAFGSNRSAGDGKAFYCKDCHNARGKESKQRLYGGTRHYHLMRRYGIGDDEVAVMIEAQGGACASCEGPLERPHVDHDHKTGKVRGILCFNCNAGLGKFQDNVDVMQLAVDYLRRHA